MGMEGGKPTKKPSKLISLQPLEAPNELDEKLEAHFIYLQEKLNGLSEKDAQDCLIALGRDQKFNDIASGGFLYGILVDPPNALTHFRHLEASSNDQWYTALLKMNMILLELFSKLRPQVHTQIVFFFAEAIKANVAKIDNVLGNLLKTINDGSQYNETCSVLLGVANILNENREWIKSLKPLSIFPGVALQCFSRFISDQMQYPNIANDRLKTALIGVCECLLHERFADIVPFLGRDLVLVLMRLSKVPQFQPIWRNLLHNPTALMPDFIGIPQLMATACTHVAITFRVSLHVARKVDFLVKLRVGNHGRHWEWFAKQHLSGPDSGSFRAELIRYLWYNLYAQEYQQPAVIDMRAHLLAWLIKNARQGAELQWCKLMLFWEWFAFDANANNPPILIEPTMSTIRVFIQQQPPMANSLLDYLIRMTSTLHPPMYPSFVSSISAAFKSLATAGMPINTIIDNQRIEKPIRDALKETFPDVYPKKTANVNVTATSTPPVTVTNNLPPIIDILDDSPEEPMPSTSAPTPEKPKKKGILKDKHKKVKKPNEDIFRQEVTQRTEAARESFLAEERSQLQTLFPMLKEEFREHVESIYKEVQENSDPSESVQLLFAAVLEEDALDDEQSELIAECWLKIFASHLCDRKFLREEEHSDEDTFEHPFYSFFRNLCSTPDGDTSRRLLMGILEDMREKNTCIGYLFLYFIRALVQTDNMEEEEPNAYEDFCKFHNTQVEEQLVADLEQCAVDDCNLFANLVPFVYSRFKDYAVGSTELMHLICSSIDSKQFLELFGEIARENIRIFKKETFNHTLMNSLQWESVEQMFFWQFVQASSVRFEWVQSVIPRLNYKKNAEAVTNVLLMLRSPEVEPGMALMRNLLCRPAADNFTVNAIKILIEEEDNVTKVGQHLANIITKQANSGELTIASQAKAPASKRTVTLEHVFAHLNQFRLHCLTKESRRAEALLANTNLQSAFASARRNEKVTRLRVQYSELFAFMEIFTSDSPSLRPQRKKRKAADDDSDSTRPKRRPNIDDSDDDR